MSNTQIIILDYGSQYTQLLARRIRDLNVYTEVVDHNIKATDIQKYKNIKGIILSGGPSSVYEFESYDIDVDIFKLGIPILGVCYGMQLIAKKFGGVVELANNQEFGKSTLVIENTECVLFKDLKESQVWMSHADHIVKMPENFTIVGKSENSIAAIENKNLKIYGIQFHAEVTHSLCGETIISNFLFNVCDCQKDWTMTKFISSSLTEIKSIIKDEKVILGLSGGVDSSVCAALLSKSIGKNLTCIFVDTGLLRKDEAKKVMQNYSKFEMNIKLVDASSIFFEALKGVKDPEQKRKIIGSKFIEIFNEESIKLEGVKFLAQGTIYPDVIESSSDGHTSKTIKSHHNVGGLPKEINFKLIEPIRTLFKDEVRRVGRELGLEDSILNRHPFPGPGLGIRIIGEVSKEKADILREVDDIFIEKLIEKKLYNKVSQAFATILPVKTVGVMGDNRTYEYLVALRSVNTIDFMTASASELPWEFLNEVTNEIINKVKGVNRVVYDITSKPPGTIEWE
ncbi:glutamine-hydrolyzing GMP synthase [Spiroplasma turonicum]|uniref:GMP synthase [glutamine-hydrolyzing] n=1 Tax=Spiroplasma turonicum TaxID=216946 RepID=A0A0K1P4X4_9MOLU|nr:glutamine-hydrolyzing GMP synthase [Spiroplasma turonicum]AKU79350.1 GMP synthase [Spiroplasma turonicum]ALX70371.1 GMP synthase [Spiroplasma turonicum]